jgi:hypothetical protein
MKHKLIHNEGCQIICVPARAVGCTGDEGWFVEWRDRLYSASLKIVSLIPKYPSTKDPLVLTIYSQQNYVNQDELCPVYRLVN